MLEHAGSRAGYGSMIRMIPERRIGVVVLNNRGKFRLPKTADKAIALALGREPAGVRPTPRQLSVDPAEADRYVGQYSQWPDRQRVEIIRSGDQLVLKEGKNEIPVMTLGEQRFVIPSSSGQLQEIFFIPGPDGKALYLHRGGRALPRVR